MKVSASFFIGMSTVLSGSAAALSPPAVPDTAAVIEAWFFTAQ